MIVNCYFWGVFFVFSTFKDMKSCNFKCHKFDKQQNIFLALTDFFLTNFKEKEVHNKKLSKHFIVYTVFKMCITKLLEKD